MLQNGKHLSHSVVSIEEITPLAFSFRLVFLTLPNMGCTPVFDGSSRWNDVLRRCNVRGWKKLKRPRCIIWFCSWYFCHYTMSFKARNQRSRLWYIGFLEILHTSQLTILKILKQRFWDFSLVNHLNVLTLQEVNDSMIHFLIDDNKPNTSDTLRIWKKAFRSDVFC